MQTMADAHGRGADFDVGNDAAGVERAGVAVGNVHIRQREGGAVFFQRQFGDGQRQLEGQRGFPRKAQNRQAVRAVGRDGNVQHLAIKLQRVHQTRAGNGAVRQHHDAGMIFRQAQLAFRADHAVGGSAAQFGLLDDQTAGHGGADQRHGHFLPFGHIGRAADDVEQLALSGVHLADVQMIGFGVIGAFHHMAYHDGGNGLVGAHNVFQLQTEHGQLVAQFLSRAFVGHKFTQP